MGIFDFLGTSQTAQVQKTLESSAAQRALSLIFMASVLSFVGTAIQNAPFIKDVFAMVSDEGGIEGLDDIADFIQLLHEAGVLGESADMIADKLQAAKALKKQWIRLRANR